MRLDDFDRLINKHVLFIYNNLLSDDAIIDSSLIEEVNLHIKDMNDYSNLLLVINTRGGNLACGYKILSMLKEKFDKISSCVITRCGSTGTFIILGSDEIFLSSKALVTPMEPQMYDVSSDTNISTSVIRNYLNETRSKEYSNIVEKIDAITFGTYISTISYFRRLCYNSFGDKSRDIVDFMLNDVDSHQMPLVKDDFKKMGIMVHPIPDEWLAMLLKEHENIDSYLNDRKGGRFNKYTLIRSNNKTRCYMKIYNSDKKKVSEGYFDVDEDEILGVNNNKKMNYFKGEDLNMIKNNKRVQDILNEQNTTSLPEYRDAYGDSHWDSYNDSHYHDNYNDTYKDYGDNSYYHDSYKDAMETNKPKVINKVYRKRK